MNADGNQVLAALICVYLRFPNFGCGFAALWNWNSAAGHSMIPSAFPHRIRNRFADAKIHPAGQPAVWDYDAIGRTEK